MQSFEIKKPDYVSLKFTLQEDGRWNFLASDPNKQDAIKNFCVRLCIQAKTNREKGGDGTFSEPEVVFLVMYFRNSGFIVERRDEGMERNLKDLLSLVSPKVAQSVEYLSYNQQAALIGKLSKFI